MERIVNELEARFGIVSHREQRPDLGDIVVAAKDVVAVLDWLKHHGGYIHLKPSERGQGACFVLVLPIREKLWLRS